MTKIVSDHSKKELIDGVEVSIERKGYMIKLDNNFFAGPQHFHLALDEVGSFFDRIEWVKPPKPELLSLGLLRAGVEDVRQT